MNSLPKEAYTTGCKELAKEKIKRISPALNSPDCELTIEGAQEETRLHRDRQRYN